jgi:ribosomal protein L11 methylase PrmA
MRVTGRVSASFRDPSGFLFWKDGRLVRQVNLSYREHFDHLMDGGLYAALCNEELIVRHENIELCHKRTADAYKMIAPEVIPFISYPYEWCFSQLKAAALHTLRIQKLAFEFGMSLKDASAYNIQFFKGRPILIDSLSFEIYCAGTPWVAFRQFCQHFYAPLALMSMKDIRLNQLFRIYMDGIPLDIASSLLPWKTWLSFQSLAYIHLHARSQARYAGRPIKSKSAKMKHQAIVGLIDSLESGVQKIELKNHKTEWSEYYDNTNYSCESFIHKKEVVSNYLDMLHPKTLWDLGGNTGVFSRIASEKGIHTVCFDVDPLAVEQNYMESSQKGDKNILPLLLDLTNPSSDLGWANEERMSFVKRGPVDVIMALALIHHLSISNNLPFEYVARFLSSLCRFIIIEFVDKSDSQVRLLLASRKDIFADYNQENFEKAFFKYFKMRDRLFLKDSKRVMYMMEVIS